MHSLQVFSGILKIKLLKETSEQVWLTLLTEVTVEVCTSTVAPVTARPQPQALTSISTGTWLAGLNLLQVLPGTFSRLVYSPALLRHKDTVQGTHFLPFLTFYRLFLCMAATLLPPKRMVLLGQFRCCELCLYVFITRVSQSLPLRRAASHRCLEVNWNCLPQPAPHWQTGTCSVWLWVRSQPSLRRSSEQAWLAATTQI